MYEELKDLEDKIIAETDRVEEAKMTNGENETLPIMSIEEVQAFFNAEDEFLKEDRGAVPVAEELDDGSQLPS